MSLTQLATLLGYASAIVVTMFALWVLAKSLRAVDDHKGEPGGRHDLVRYSATHYTYGPWIILWNPKPGPGFEWDWYHVDYDGPEDSRCGSAHTLEDAILEIEEWEDDNI